MKYREFYSGFIRLHVLYHAGKGPVFGLWLMKELGRHGYQISPGTLYPILHNLEQSGYLKSERRLHQAKYRRVYEITESGRKALGAAGSKIKELFKELIEQK